MSRACNLFCEAGDDLVHCGVTFFDHFNNDPLLDEAFLFVQIFERRSAAYSRQKGRESVLRRAKVKMRDPRSPANFVKVEAPVSLRGSHQRLAFSWEMKRLAEEVGEAEADVKRRVTEMKHFVIEQNQLVVMHENVLRAEVAMHQRVGAAQRPVNQFFQKRRHLWDDRCALLVVRFKSQCLEEMFAREDGRKFMPKPEAFAMN